MDTLLQQPEDQALELNEIIAVVGIAFTSFMAGYLLSEMHSFRKYIKENCLKETS